ncbi:hypothetical protein SAMN05428988_0155 [Chitinophaga sp. YR573]|uniref:hypothetical protein n=1 Tax=Chitinophaga sp. YR573 TaxID=1881040 RepID=UPI0008D31C9F|nr:hypothetical protein [Chitinophaga sp. YR573]SEV88897.1 hypothetical protein SAMN05428988_0155 [Chitinophaga sp. YR573]
MVVQYPHTLTATIVAESHQDDDGNWVPGSDTTREIKCRVEPNGGGRQVQVADGSLIVYSSIVYMPRGTTPLQDGTRVSITSSPVTAGAVLRFSQGQLNSRLWL